MTRSPRANTDRTGTGRNPAGATRPFLPRTGMKSNSEYVVESEAARSSEGESNHAEEDA